MKNVFILLLLFLATLQAKEYKAVFDCSSGNAHYIQTRMWLVDKTMSMIEAQGDKANFAITLHGSCVDMVSKTFEDIVDDNDMPFIQKAQDYIKLLVKKRGVKVVVCAMSLDAKGIKKDDVLEFVKISENSFIDTIGFQNDGYALMTFK